MEDYDNRIHFYVDLPQNSTPSRQQAPPKITPSLVQNWLDDMEDYDSRIHDYLDLPQNTATSRSNQQTPTTTPSTVAQDWMDDMDDYDSRIHYYVDPPQKPTMPAVLEGLESRHNDLDHESRQILILHLEDAFLRRHAWE